ncbi:MAG TPA: hypothetical protein VFX51_28965 [Solirubrobacteraceae bacterium]|nr:hypothetical protein [Solirubrobacteraceae bacterium]
MSRPLLAAPATLTLALAFAPGASAQMSFDGPVDYDHTRNREAVTVR